MPASAGMDCPGAVSGPPPQSRVAVGHGLDYLVSCASLEGQVNAKMPTTNESTLLVCAGSTAPQPLSCGLYHAESRSGDH